MAGQGGIRRVVQVCHRRTAQPEEGERGGRFEVCRPLRGETVGACGQPENWLSALSGGCLRATESGCRPCRGVVCGQPEVVGGFGERLPGKASDRGDFWGSGVSRSKRKQAARCARGAGLERVCSCLPSASCLRNEDFFFYCGRIIMSRKRNWTLTNLYP